MIRLSILVLLALVVSARAAVNVDFSFSDFVSNPLQSKSVTLTPVQSPGGAGQTIISGSRISWDTGTNGTFTVSNMVAGAYSVEITAPSATTKFYIVVPSTATSNVPAISILSQPLATAGSQMAYTGTASDRRYRPIAGTNIVIYTNSDGYIVISSTAELASDAAFAVSNYFSQVISNNAITVTNLDHSIYHAATNFTFVVSNKLNFAISNSFITSTGFTFSVSNSLWQTISNSSGTGGVSQAYVTLRTNEVFLSSSNMARVLALLQADLTYKAATNFTYTASNGWVSTVLSSNATYVTQRTNELFLSSSNMALVIAQLQAASAYRGATNFTFIVSNVLWQALSNNVSTGAVNQAYVTSRTNELFITSSNLAYSFATNAYRGATNFTFIVSNVLQQSISNVVATNTVNQAYVTSRTNEVFLSSSNMALAIAVNAYKGATNYTYTVSNALYNISVVTNIYRYNLATWTQIGMSNLLWTIPDNSAIILAPGEYPTYVKYPPAQTFPSLTNQQAAFKFQNKTNIAIMGDGGLAIFLITNPVGANAGDTFWAKQCDKFLFQNVGVMRPVKADYTGGFSVDLNLENCRNVEVDRCIFKNGHDHAVGEALRDLTYGQLSSNIVVRDCYFEHYGQTNFGGVSLAVDGTAVTVAGALLVTGCTFTNCHRGIETWNEDTQGLVDDIIISGNRFINCYNYAIINPSSHRGNHVIVTGNIFEKTPEAIYAPGLFYSIGINGQFENWLIANNTFRMMDYGVICQGTGWRGLTIANNQFMSNGCAIQTWNPSNGSTNSSGCTISGNQMFGCQAGMRLEAVLGLSVVNNYLEDCDGYVVGSESPIHINTNAVGRAGRGIVTGNIITGFRTNVTGSVYGIAFIAGVSNFNVFNNIVTAPYFLEVNNPNNVNTVITSNDMRRMMPMQPFVISPTNSSGRTQDLFVVNGFDKPFTINSNGVVELRPNSGGSVGTAASNILIHLMPNLGGAQPLESLDIQWSARASGGGAQLLSARMGSRFYANTNGGNIFVLGMRDLAGNFDNNRFVTIQGDGRFMFGTNDGTANFRIYGFTSGRTTLHIQPNGNTTNVLQVASSAGALQYGVNWDGSQVLDFTNDVRIFHGAVDPSGVITAGRGSQFIFTPATNIMPLSPYMWINTNGTSGWRAITMPL